jgi:hypothetical protein
VQPTQAASTQERWVGTLSVNAVKVAATVPVATACRVSLNSSAALTTRRGS